MTREKFIERFIGEGWEVKKDDRYIYTDVSILSKKGHCSVLCYEDEFMSISSDNEIWIKIPYNIVTNIFCVEGVFVEFGYGCVSL